MALNDTCIYLEGNSGDGGAHSGVLWLSPDININVGTANEGKATTGSNVVRAVTHRKSNCIPLNGGEPASVLIDVYVGDPSIVMTPGTTDKISPSSLGFPDATTISVAGVPQTFNWTPSGSGNQSQGHKCLIAVAYPDTDSVPGGAFDVSNQHVAQHNITICPCSSPCGVDVKTINPNFERPELVLIRAMADVAPNRYVTKVVKNVLKAVKDFKRIRTANLPPFRFEFKGHPEAALRHYTKPSSKGTFGRCEGPNIEARIELKPKQRIKFRFALDMEEARFGDAFIFHLTQFNQRKRLVGGLTVVAVRTKMKL
jgi:hypothetical protein